MSADNLDHNSDRATPAWQRFFAHESSAGLILGAAALVALLLSNSPWAPAYSSLVNMMGEVRIGHDALVLAKPLVVWVNDLWMAVFFFLIGLEIKREWTQGELADRRQALLPAAAALGGMVAPAAIYSAVNWGNTVAMRGWAIPTATDIAFALGVLALLGSRVPGSLKVFLTAVAIIDDLGAIVVIAIFYTEQLSVTMLAGAGVGIVGLVGLRVARITRVELYLLIGGLIWLFVLKSGVHATLAGVVTALAIPMRAPGGRQPALELEQGLHPWVAFAILPCFAFANAGVSLQGVGVTILLEPLPSGIVLGLVAGKAAGVFGSVWLMVRSGLAERPRGASWAQVFGVAVLCGIGFTMSLFIGSLAFEGLDPHYESRVKLGVLCGSLIAGTLGSGILWWAGRARSARVEPLSA